MTTTTAAADPVPLDDLGTYLDALRHAQTELAKWQDTINLLKKHLTDRLGDAQVGTVDGRPAVRWTVVTSNRVNTTALKKAHPDLVEQYTTTSVARRFTLVDQGGAA